MNTFKKILSLLSRQERSRGCLLLFMILVMAILDALGVASIIPFLSVIGDPKVVVTNRWLSLAYNEMGFTSHRDFLFLLGLLVFALLVLSIVFKALTQWAMLRFTFMRIHFLSCRLFQGYLGRPYAWFLNRHSADLGSSILNETSYVVNQVIAPFMGLLAQATASMFLIILLIIVNPVLALMVAFILGGSYLSIYMILRRYLSRIGADRVAANKERFQVAQEALSGIKEVKIFGREEAFYNRFIGPSYRVARHLANGGISGMMPRYLLEMLAFGGILIITLYLFRAHEDFGLILPILGVYAFAGYRLLPALQQVFQHSTQFRFGLAALDGLCKDVLQIQKNQNTTVDQAAEPLSPESVIILEDIHFTYPEAKIPTLRGISLKISVNTTVGVVGSTGSGKTTVADIILGLLSPDKGRLLVDGNTINAENARLWQKTLGYVPQNIFLADDTVAANIAFGVPSDKIDMHSVKNAAKIAELHDFVISDLPFHYDTLVGERGVRLSGGQRQRIGIARALYHDPRVLVFDEATSALDNVTEKCVMQAIKRMKGDRTIILIAHRLSTVSDCDLIYFLEQGEVKGRGTYDELLKESNQFRKMASGIARNI